MCLGRIVEYRRRKVKKVYREDENALCEMWK